LEGLGRPVQADILVFAVSGFLGKGSDWSKYKSALNENFDFQTIDLFSPTILRTNSLSSFNFVDYLLKEIQFISKSYKKRIFLGYSFGGRLGLKLMQLNPNLFDEWVFVSTGIGLVGNNTEDRAARLENDKNWARKMTLGNWALFLKEWNAQIIFKDSLEEPERELKDYDISLLRHALISQSLAVQPDFRDLVKANKNNLQWVVGSKDEKYLKMAEEIKSLGCIDNFLKLNGGHRLTFDAPLELADLFNKKAD
jgi:2-succinyl-6-hydroxy-2,4-cyclohexadiene-1-carboxylate synthase